MAVASMSRGSLIVVLLMLHSVEALNDHRPVRRRTKRQDDDGKAARGNNENEAANNIFQHVIPEKAPEVLNNDPASAWMDSFLMRNGVHDSKSAPKTPKGTSNAASQREKWISDLLERNGVHFERDSSVDEGDQMGEAEPSSNSRIKSTSGRDPVDSWIKEILERYDNTKPHTSGKGGKGKKKSKKSSSLSPSPSPSPFPFLHSPSPSPAGTGFSKSKKSKSSKKKRKKKSSKSKAHPSPSPSPSPSPQPTQFPTGLPTEAPTITPTKSPTGSPTASPTTPPTLSPTMVPTMSPSQSIISRAPTIGTVVYNELCSKYETVSGNPVQDEFGESADLTCTHIEEVVIETLEMASPSFLILQSATCSPLSTAADPVEICYEIVTVFAADSSIVLTEEEMGELICISVSEPAVDTLLDDLASLPTSNPFSSTTGLTCNDSSATGTPTIAPVGGSTPEPISSAPVSTRGYEITQELLMPPQDQAVFEASAARWESLIIGDLPDVDSSLLPEGPSEGCTYPPIIDDLYICGVLEPIDGMGNQVGLGRAIWLRPDNNLPITGEMIFDVEDLDYIRSLGLLEDLILHEMGHVIGIGTVWTDTGVAGPEPENCPYLGARATAEYQAISGCNTAVPVQQTGGTATRCKHWEETCFLNELMTGELNTNGNPLSRITVGNLEDMGYVVDYANTDPYETENLDPSCVCRRRRRDLWDGEHGEVLVLKSDDRRTLRKPLREDLRQYAIQQGKRLLDNSPHMESIPGGAIYVGDKRVSIMMLQDDTLYGVIVTSDDVPN